MFLWEVNKEIETIVWLSRRQSQWLSLYIGNPVLELCKGFRSSIPSYRLQKQKIVRGGWNDVSVA